MNTKQQTEQPDQPDVIPDKENIPLMVRAAAFTVFTSFWPHGIYHPDIKGKVMLYLRKFIEDGAVPFKAYAEFCQRILMARHYVEHNPGYILPNNILQWLDPRNGNGFAGTEDWYARLEEKRKLEPFHLMELKAFPEALLELAEDPSPGIFHYWAAWFLERKAYDEHLLLQLAGIQLLLPEMNEV